MYQYICIKNLTLEHFSSLGLHRTIMNDFKFIIILTHLKILIKKKKKIIVIVLNIIFIYLFV